MSSSREAWEDAPSHSSSLGARREDVQSTLIGLQNLKTQKDYMVTLNPSKKISNELIIKKMQYTHPLYSFSAFESQKELAKLNGVNNTFFCGSYFGNGFHEDGVHIPQCFVDPKQLVVKLRVG